MAENISKIEFTRDPYIDHNDKDSESYADIMMWQDVSDFVKILIKHDYQCKIWCDGYAVSVEFDFRGREYTGNDLVWIGPNDYVGTCPAVSPSDDADEP